MPFFYDYLEEVTMELIRIEKKNGQDFVSSLKEIYLDAGMDKTHWSRWCKKNIVENIFLSENEDYKTFFTMENGNETDDFSCSVDTAYSLLLNIKPKNEVQAYSLNETLKYLKPNISHVFKHSNSRFEISFIEDLEEALYEINIKDGIKQFNVDDKYRVDYYIPSLNFAVEYDESHHNYTIEEDSYREEYIIEKIKCKFIRCCYKDSNIKNVVKVLISIGSLQRRGV